MMHLTKKELIQAYKAGKIKEVGVHGLSYWSGVYVVEFDSECVFGFYGYMDSNDEMTRKFFKLKLHEAVPEWGTKGEPQAYFTYNKSRYYLSEFMRIGA